MSEYKVIIRKAPDAAFVWCDADTEDEALIVARTVQHLSPEATVLVLLQLDREEQVSILHGGELRRIDSVEFR